MVAVNKKYLAFLNMAREHELSFFFQDNVKYFYLTLMHSEQPKLYPTALRTAKTIVLAVLSAIGLRLHSEQPTLYSFGYSGCNRFKGCHNLISTVQ